MLPVSLLVVFLWLFPHHITGSETAVFLQTGEDLFLNVTEKDVKNFDLSYWQKNSKGKLVIINSTGDPTVEKNCTGRIEVLKKNKNIHVILKKLQKSDSGDYSFRVAGEIWKILKTYKVTVQDPVSPVELSAVPMFNASSFTCIVTCRSADSNISSTLTCENKTCHQDGGLRSVATKSGDSLSINLSNGLIICNHSNQVSKNHSTTAIQSCFRPKDQIKVTTDAAPTVSPTVYAAAVSAPLVVLVIAILLYYLKKMKRLCFAQRQTGSSNSQMLPEPLQVNGHPRSDPLMEAEESAV